MSKRILLTQGKFAIVDDDMFDYLNQWKWVAVWKKSPKSFYAARTNKKENSQWHIISMARVILELNDSDKRQPDHIDHNTLDNRKANLRIVTHQQNHWNRKNPKGYSWNKTAQKYLAQITLNGKHIYLGLFHTTKEARNAYLEAKKHYHNIQT